MTTPSFPWELAAAGVLRDVLQAIERGGMRVAVATEAGRVVGIMTDGDARRALLSGGALDSDFLPYLNRTFASVEPSVTRNEVLDLMQARGLDVVPIVDADGTLRGMHRLHGVIGDVKRQNWAVIMAGGRGTRLGTLTEHLPKPMVRVAGRPIIERLVLHLVSHGIERIFISTNYLAHMIEGHFGDGAKFGCAITYLREERPLGTAGALSLLPEQPAHPLLVVNGDLVTQADLGSMLDAHERGGQGATIGVRPYFHTVPFGCLELDGDRVARIEEKPRIGRIVNAGVYVLSPAFLSLVPSGAECTMPGLMEDALARGDVVRAFEMDDDWIDVGQREQLRRARGEDP